jgi:hypothetical protein
LGFSLIIMPLPYEILIRGKVDGTLSGGHIIETPNGEPKPIGTVAVPWEEIAQSINGAFLEANAALTARVTELESAADHKSSVLAAVHAAAVSENKEEVARLAQEFDATEKQRTLAEKEKQAEQLAEEIAKLKK